MGKVAISESYLMDIADAIRARGGSTDTFTPAEMANAIIDIPIGGASNFVHGTFITSSSAGARIVTIPYTGSGYPIMALVVVAGGAYVSGTDWYNSMQRYAVGQWAMTKSVMDTAPTYSTSGAQNWGVAMAIYKNSTTSSTSYSRGSSMNANSYSSSNANNSVATCVRFKSKTSMSVYTNTSSYGLLPDTEYEYFIVYSS